MSPVSKYDHVAVALCHEINAHCGGCVCRREHRLPCVAMITQARRFMLTIGVDIPTITTLAHGGYLKAEAGADV